MKKVDCNKCIYYIIMVGCNINPTAVCNHPDISEGEYRCSDINAHKNCKRFKPESFVTRFCRFFECW